MKNVKPILGKRALVLSGGGSKGAYQVGVIKKLAEEGKTWDIITGVSVGALNACFLSMYNKNEQIIAAKELEHFWLQNVKKDSDSYKGWLPGFLTYIPAIWKGSIYSTKPLKKLLINNFNIDKMKTTDVDIHIGVCSLNSGLYETVNGNHPQILDYILASASFPIAFPPIEIGGELYTDGGVRNSVPVMEAIRSGASEIDVIMNSPTTPATIHKDTKDIKKLIPAALRVTDILSDEVFITDLDEACKYHGIKLKVHAPERPFKQNSLDFSAKHVVSLIDYGYNGVLIHED